jgi:hypothetical protein
MLGFMAWVPNIDTLGTVFVVIGRTCWWAFITSSFYNFHNPSSTNGQRLNMCPTCWQYEQVIILAPWFPFETGLWCGTCDLSLGLDIDLTCQVLYGYVTPCRIIVGVVWSSTCSNCGIEIDWLDGLRSMWRSCSNLLNRWSHSISKLVGTKLILVFSECFWKPTYVVINVNALVLGKLYPRVANRHGCYVETTSSNGWTCSWLSSW